MKNPNTFQDIADRLVRALGVPTETELALRLGLSQTAWSKRKMRDALPTTEIGELIAREMFSADYIYQGIGGLYEGAGWESEYKARTGDLRLAKLPLMEAGHLERTIDALISLSIKDVYKANAFAFVAALRDSFRFVELDLTYLISGVDLRNDTDQPTTMDKDERLLVKAYRDANTEGKKFIRNAATMAAK